jgi:hypothetical protein
MLKPKLTLVLVQWPRRSSRMRLSRLEDRGTRDEDGKRCFKFTQLCANIILQYPLRIRPTAPIQLHHGDTVFKTVVLQRIHSLL